MSHNGNLARRARPGCRSCNRSPNCRKNLPTQLKQNIDKQFWMRQANKFNSLGTDRKSTGRFLYAAANPIGEECFRECGFELSESLIDDVVIEAEPWIDFWRDNYAFVASRVAAGFARHLDNVDPQRRGAASRFLARL